MPNDFTIVFLGQEPKGSATLYRYQVKVPGQTSQPGLLSGPGWPALRVGQSASSLGVGFVSKQGKKFPAFYGGKRNRFPTFWFSLPATTIPPSWVCLVVKAPPPGREYKSNLAETTL